MHGHGDCPGCIQPLVGHDADCEVMSERAPAQYVPCTFPGCASDRRTVNTHGVWHCERHQLDAGWVQTQDRIEARKRAQAAPASPGAPQSTPEPQDTGKTPAARIRERIAEKRSLYEHYHQHTKRMWEEHDAHGGWDSFINGSEVSNRIDELEWCLAVIEGRE